MTTTRIIKTPYGDKPQQSIGFTGDGRTKQSFKAECDINNIMAKARKTGLVDFVTKNQPIYADVVGADFQAAMDTIRAGEELFEQLPSGIRKRFNNNPGEFLGFMNDPENTDEAVRLGLINPEVAPPKEKAPVAPAAPPAAPVAPPGAPAAPPATP